MKVAHVKPGEQGLWICFWLGALFSCLPFVCIYLSRMWRLPQYQYFPFAIGVVVWLTWVRGNRRFYPPESLLSLGSVAFGVVFMIGGLLIKSPWLVAIAAVCFATGCLSTMRGGRYTSLVTLALPLALLIRLPLGYDLLLVIELQRITTVLSSLMLDVLGVANSISHNVIKLPHRELFVAEACSGIQSVFTLAFLSTLLIAISNRRMWLTPIYLGIALLLAVAGNVIRVTTVAAVDTWFGSDWAEGWAHDFLGYTTLGVAALFLVSFDQIIVAILHPTGNTSGSAKGNPLAQLWNWLVDDGTHVDPIDEYYRSGEDIQTPASTSFRDRLAVFWARFDSPWMVKALAFMGIVLFGLSTVRAFSVDRMGVMEGAQGMFVDGLLFDPGPGLVEAFASDFELSDHTVSRENATPVLGRNADIWKYRQKDGLEGQFVLSQAYSSFHELCFCYEKQDWLLLNRSLKTHSNDSAGLENERSKTAPFAFARFRTGLDTNAYLWYASVTASGDTPTPPARPGVLTGRFRGSDSESYEPVMMLQLWVTSGEPLKLSESNEIADDFARLRAKIAAEVAR